MTSIYRFTYTRAAFAALIAAAVFVSAGPANAVIYCKAYGVPRGCVARAPIVHKPVVYCKTVGVPKGCVVR
jgi:hypothetical protein